MSVLIPSQFDITQFSFNKEIKAPNGKVGIKQTYSAYGPRKQNLIMQTPYMWAPFGVSTNEDPVSGKVEKYTVQLSFGKEDERQPELIALFEAFSAIDEYAKQLAFENSVAFFGKKKTMEQLSALYHPIIQYAIDKETGERTDKYAPRFKAKIPYDKKNERIIANVYDTNKESFDLIDGLAQTKGAECRGVLKVSSLWIGTTGFGITIQIDPMEIKFRGSVSNHTMIDLDDDANKRTSTKKQSVNDTDSSDDEGTKPVKLQENTFKEDSSDDEEKSEEESEEEEKPPVKKPSAKSRAKK